MNRFAIEDLVVDEWESFWSLEDSTSRASSLSLQDEMQTPDPFQVAKSGRKYITSSDMITQALEHAGRHRDEPSQCLLQKTTYGTNEDVYNPYQPFLSKEYIVQEIAAGRMRPTEGAQDSPRGLLTVPGTSRRSFSRPSEETNQPPYTGPANWISRNHREAALAVVAKRNAEISRSEEVSNLSSHLINDSAHRLRRSYLYPFRDEDLDESEPGFHIKDEAFPAYLPERTSLDSDEQVTSHSDLLSSSQYHMMNEQLRGSSYVKETAEEAQPSPGRHFPALTDMQTIYQSRDRKRRRADRSPEDAIVPRRPRRLSVDHSSAISTSKTPRFRDQAELYVELRISCPRARKSSACAIVGSWQDPLSEELLQFLELTSAHYSGVHSSTPALTVTTASMSLVSPYVFDPFQRIFTSECVPQSFSPQKRRDVLDIFRTKAPYVPACVLMVRDLVNIRYHVADSLDAFRPASSQLQLPQPGSGRTSQAWPRDLMPLELFEQIASYLPHEDLKSMRLVNKEFEWKISGYMFKFVVVPFGPEIYALARQDTKHSVAMDEKSTLLVRCKQRSLRPQSKIWKPFDMKGKGKQEGFQQNPLIRESRDGMEMFDAWGCHVKKFAMVFEVQDDELARPLVKGKYLKCPTWWGQYRWPLHDYPRYDYCSGLEQKADEYPRMCYALSKLFKVQELGLSIDNGLGWLPGPDTSDRRRIFHQKSTIFGCREAEENGRNARCQKTWDKLVDSIAPQPPVPSVLQDSHLSAHLTSTQSSLAPVLTVPYNAPFATPTYTHHSLERRPLIFEGINLSNVSTGGLITSVDFRNLAQGPVSPRFLDRPVVPNQLTRAQKEWLMEIEWAQEAFMTSYCLAIIDNRDTFKNVLSINIAKLSSKLVTKLQRKDVWEGLPSLSSVTIIVAADFRIIRADGPGEVQLLDIPPSNAVEPFFILLRDYLAKVKNIKFLTIGYFGGGEHQAGIFGRNRFVLPAPLADWDNETVFTNNLKETLFLPHVQNLTLQNCWMTPSILKNLVSIMKRASLRSLNLESVSLTAHVGIIDSIQPDILENGLSRHLSRGQRRSKDPHVPEGFYSQRHLDSDPGLDDAIDWIYNPPRVGSWADVLNAISPGPTLDLVRYAFQYSDQAPAIPSHGKLEVINFASCGYVRLVNQTTLDQSSIPEESFRMSRALYSRAIDLMPVMMDCHRDQLLGHIVPNYDALDLSVFKTGFPMTLGWGDNESKYDNLEDGRPEGGSGRFTGRLEMLKR